MYYLKSAIKLLAYGFVFLNGFGLFLFLYAGVKTKNVVSSPRSSNPIDLLTHDQYVVGCVVAVIASAIATLVIAKIVGRLFSGAKETFDDARREINVSANERKTKENESYRIVANEVSRNEIDDALWVKAFENANGDKERQKALYIRYRVRDIQKSH